MILLFSIIVFLAIGLVAFYFSIQTKQRRTIEFPRIYASGIYSVIRRSPREIIHTVKPSAQSIQEFLQSQKTDLDGQPLHRSHIKALVQHYTDLLEANIRVIEEADQKGEDNFLLTPGDCQFCQTLGGRKAFLNRDMIHSTPEIIPPYFPGCTCRLSSLPPDSTLNGSVPLKMNDSTRYGIPEWRNCRIIK
jgi:hypothetical protein